MKGVSKIGYWKFYLEQNGPEPQLVIKIAANNFESAKKAFKFHTGEEPVAFDDLGHLCILGEVFDSVFKMEPIMEKR